MSELHIHDLHDSQDLDQRAMVEVRGGWFGVLLTSTDSGAAPSRSLYDACCTGTHIPTATLGV